MIRITGRHAMLMAAIVCAGLAGGGLVAVQAAASDGRSGPAVPGPGKPLAPPLLRHHVVRAVPAITATNAHCGQTITASLTLNGDLSCSSGNGLTVSGTSVVLNLGGHQITGNQTSGTVGVHLFGASETVTNGVVAKFETGVFVEGTSDTVSTVRSTFNSHDGIVDAGVSTKLTTDVVYGNEAYGIVGEASTATYSGDHELNNTFGGLYLSGFHGVTVTSNVANGNGGYGIEDEGNGGDTLKTDTANYNALDGIYVTSISVIDGGGNIAKGNDYGSGATPEQCFGVVCS